MKKWSLKMTVQCKSCPFKVSTNPKRDIPNYSLEQHKELINTVNKGFNDLGDTLRIMACHCSNEHEQYHCIGWIYNQIGVGNNIPLRLKMMFCENRQDIKVIGEQHRTIQETIK